MDDPDLLAAFFDALAKGNDQDSSVSGHPNGFLQWPLHSTDARDYTVSPHAGNNTGEPNTGVDMEWFEHLSVTSNTISPSNNPRTCNEFPHPHLKPPTRLLTPSSPSTPVPGLSNPGPKRGPGMHGKQHEGGKGAEATRTGRETGLLHGPTAHSRKVGRLSGYVHVKGEGVVA